MYTLYADPPKVVEVRVFPKRVNVGFQDAVFSYGRNIQVTYYLNCTLQNGETFISESFKKNLNRGVGFLKKRTIFQQIIKTGDSNANYSCHLFKSFTYLGDNWSSVSDAFTFCPKCSNTTGKCMSMSVYTI